MDMDIDINVDGYGRRPPPLNQASLYATLSSSVEDADGEEDEGKDEEDEGDGDGLAEPPLSLSFRTWFVDDRNVPPENKVAYIMMTMTTLDESFSVEAPPYNRVKTNKKKHKPTLNLYKKELRRRDPKIGVSNKKTDSILSLLRSNLRLLLDV